MELFVYLPQLIDESKKFLFVFNSRVDEVLPSLNCPINKKIKQNILDKFEKKLLSLKSMYPFLDELYISKNKVLQILFENLKKLTNTPLPPNTKQNIINYIKQNIINIVFELQIYKTISKKSINNIKFYIKIIFDLVTNTNDRIIDLIFTVDVFTSFMMLIDIFVEILFINGIYKKTKFKIQQKMLKLIAYYKKNNKLNKNYFADIITIFIIQCMKIFVNDNSKLKN
jgi:hypothetical protein